MRSWQIRGTVKNVSLAGKSTQMDNLFVILADEVLLYITSFLDARSFFHFCGCSRALKEFSHVSNEQWRIFYSIQWCVYDRELRGYTERDWCSLFKQRFRNETGPKPASLAGEHKVLATEVPAALVSIHDKILLNSQAFDDSIDLMEKMITGFTEQFKHTNETSTNILTLLADSLTALDKALRTKKQKILIGLMSLLADIVEHRYDLQSVNSAAILLCTLHAENDIISLREFKAIADNLQILNHFVSFFEETVDPRSITNTLNVIALLLSGNSSDATAALIRRQFFMKKLVQLMNTVPATSSVTSHPRRDVMLSTVSSIASVDADYAASQGLYDLILATIFNLDLTNADVLVHAVNAVNNFLRSKVLRLKIASNTALLKRLLEILKQFEESKLDAYCRQISWMFSELCSRRESVQFVYEGHYLEDLLPYLKKITTKVFFADMCDVIGGHLRFGNENMCTDLVHRKLEPYLPTIINHEHFKESIMLWVSYYCGMPMPIDITKNLVERIIPELPLEPDIDVARAYVELLGNIVQLYGDVFSEVDIKPAFEHMTEKLILDEDRDRASYSSERNSIPYTMCFLFASVTLPQAAQLAVRNAALLDKMCSLYSSVEQNETIYMVAHFFSHIVKLAGWDNSRGLDVLSRFASTIPLDVELSLSFVFIEPYAHLFVRDNPVEMPLFGSWIVARMAQTPHGREGLKRLSPDVIEWLSSHSDMRIRKNMNHYHHCMETAKKAPQMDDVNYLNVVSNEVISCIISFLDASSFFHFCGCSHALKEFSHVSNEQWRIFYSIQWYIDDRELQGFNDRDWHALFKERISNEKLFLKRVGNPQLQVAESPSEALLEQCISMLRGTTQNKGVFLHFFGGSKAPETPEVIDNSTMEVCPFETAVSCLGKLMRQRQICSEKLFGYLTVLDMDLRSGKRQERFGIVSLLADIIDVKFNVDAVQAAALMLNHMHTWSEASITIEELRVIVENLRILPRVFEVFEKVANGNLEIALLRTMQLCLKKSSKDTAQLIRRPAFMKKLKAAIASSLPKFLHCSISVVSNVVQIDPDYAASQGFLDTIVDILYKQEDHGERSTYYLVQALMRFCKSETVSVKIANNSVLLNHLLSLLRKESKDDESVYLSSIVMLFDNLALKPQCLSIIFDGYYLDQLLSYLNMMTDFNTFSSMCDLMGCYLRNGIETLRLDLVHKKIEPYFEIIIDHEHFPESIPFWQNYYCGMAMPLEITKSLVQRIIPELPFEEDIIYSRSYVELLSNIVQTDQLDIQLVFDHLAVNIILDEDRGGKVRRGSIPYPLSFLSASASLPQAAQLAINNAALLDKMYSLYSPKEDNETMYMVAYFFSHIARLAGWDSKKGLELMALFGATMPVDAPMYFLFTFIEPYMHLFVRDNPVEMPLFGSWMIARMAQTKEGRAGLQKLSSDVIEWLASHSDMRIRKNMNHYHHCMETAKKTYDF